MARFGSTQSYAGSRNAQRFLPVCEESNEVKRQDLRPYLEAEIENWSSKPYETLRAELKEGFADAREGLAYHVEVELLENRDDYLQVSVAVCSEAAPWSCYHPLSASFIVRADGRVEK